MTIHCVDERYSTTRMFCREAPDNIHFMKSNPNRIAEGGLRMKNFWKRNVDDRPLISVITVVFNGKDYLEETIQSVLGQDYDNVEYIIIDGGSNDGTLEIIQRYEDRIDYWVSEADNGIYDAMNKAIGVSSGEWLNFMNAGDHFYQKETLEKIVQYTNMNKDVIYSDLYLYSTKNNNIEFIKSDIDKLFVVHQAMIYKKDLHEKHGLYVVHKDLTISDYIFFNLIDRNCYIKSEFPISKNLDGGISSNFGHIREKFSVDLLFNNINFFQFIFYYIKSFLIRVLKK